MLFEAFHPLTVLKKLFFGQFFEFPFFLITSLKVWVGVGYVGLVGVQDALFEEVSFQLAFITLQS